MGRMKYGYARTGTDDGPNASSDDSTGVTPFVTE
jgi:hypothetical protein